MSNASYFWNPPANAADADLVLGDRVGLIAGRGVAGARRHSFGVFGVLTHRRGQSGVATAAQPGRHCARLSEGNDAMKFWWVN